LYLNNLNEKITTLELKTNLFFLFIPFGEIQAIILKKNKKLRGQAFIVFKNEIISSMAMKTL
jgi:RNA recognition motif-containing protein